MKTMFCKLHLACKFCHFIKQKQNGIQEQFNEHPNTFSLIYKKKYIRIDSLNTN